MDYLYKKTPSKQYPPKNEIILPATIVTQDIPKPESEVKQLGHITFISQEEYLRDIETMCQRDKWFMETIRGFCDKVVAVNVEQPIQSDKSTSISGEGSE